MFRCEVSKAHPFILSLFGCQYHSPQPDAKKTALIQNFDRLLDRAAAHVETLEQNEPTPPVGASRVWMSYWKCPEDYQRWWSSLEVSDFWNSLPDDAGFWREKLSLPHSRVMFESNKNTHNGYSHVGALVPLTEKTGYWGAYRDRLEDATPSDRLKSPLSKVPPAKAQMAQIRKGRVIMDSFPDNLCVVIEGQDHRAMKSEEREHWNERFDHLTKSWVTHVVGAGADAGMVSARLCYAPHSGKVEACGDVSLEQGWAQAFSFNRRVQILYFLDLSYMERIGRNVKTHVELRRKFMESYAPTGPMSNGDLLLWVELGVLKGQDMEAEYVGCYEGTGFLAYEGDAAFEQKNGAGYWFPLSIVGRISQYLFG
ncbi:heme-containing dehydratase protein [Macrophomina phaseolina]|uniref:Heme-containing dehydratase protein n=1 Tax=Macrophomina phaseolina TaxID=35725 RepID=A0ABQ8GJW0_9PEZI|nr:heme-containing dehydratase protein [Macrophomina phaseolina]